MRPPSERAQALVEFALTLPILILLVAIAVDFGREFSADLSLRDGAFAAARYAGMNPNDDAGIVKAAIAAAGGLQLAAANVAISPPSTPPRHSGQAVTVTLSYRFQPLTPLLSTLLGGGLALSRSQTDIVK